MKPVLIAAVIALFVVGARAAWPSPTPAAIPDRIIPIPDRIPDKWTPAIDVLLTDMEPDDMLGIGVLVKRGIGIRMMVVGEGDPAHKRLRATEMVNTDLFTTVPKIMMGAASDVLGPGESKPDSLRVSNTRVWLEALDSSVKPVLMCTKPPREIIYALTHFPELAYRVFSRTTLYMYGSFNLRTLGYASTLTLVNEDTTPFLCVYLYESHMAKTIPNLNPDTMPDMPTWFQHQPGFRTLLFAYTKAWDTFIAQDCRESMARTQVNSAAWARNAKCLQEVQQHAGEQFVPADAILAVLAFNARFEGNIEAVRVIHDGDPTSYPVLAHSTPMFNRKVFAWRGLAAADIMTQLSQACAS